MGETVVNSAMRLLAGAHALEPVGRMLQCQITHAHWRKLRFTGQENVFRRPFFVDVGIVFVITLLLHQAVARTALAAVVDERGLLAHVAREGRSVVAKTGGVADQKSLGIFQECLESMPP